MRQKMRQKMNYKKKIALFFRQVWAVIDKYQSREAGKGYFFSFVLLPVLVVFGIESMARHSMLQGLEFVIFHPYAFLANVLIVLTSFTITLFLTKRIGTDPAAYGFLAGLGTGGWNCPAVSSDTIYQQ